MFDRSLIEVPQDIFGGYCPAIPPSNLPSGAASIAQDCEFPQSAVKMRGGLTSLVQHGPYAVTSVTGGGDILTAVFVFPSAIVLRVGQTLNYSGGDNPAVVGLWTVSVLVSPTSCVARPVFAFFNPNSVSNGGQVIVATKLAVIGSGGTTPPSSINGLKSYVTPTLDQRLLVYDSLGNFLKDNPQDLLNYILQRPYPNLFMQSTTLFGREYQAFFDKMGGADIPRQYDDTNWDRVSECGAGLAPTVADETAGSYTIKAAGVPGLSPDGEQVTIASISETGNLITAVLSSLFVGFPPQVGDQITLVGVTNAAYNGNYIVSSVNGLQVQFPSTVSGLTASSGGSLSTWAIKVQTTTTTNYVIGDRLTIAGAGIAGYDGTSTVRAVGSPPPSIFWVAATAAQGVLANSGGGTTSRAGNIAAGLHQVSVCLVSRQGAIFPAAPPASWTAAGNKRAIVTGIVTAPGNDSNIVARLLLFTPVITPPATTGSFYSLPNGSSQVPSSVMLIPDKETTTVTVDFTDPVLSAGFQANYLFSQLELGECAFVVGYNSRLLWMGERNHLANFVNLGFDGGLDENHNFVPGWTGLANANGAFSEWQTDAAGVPQNLSGGYGYKIVGDGVTAKVGLITQPACKDYLGVPIVQPALGYGVRVRVKRDATLAQGTLHINLKTSGAATAGLSVTAAQAGLGFQEFIANLTDTPFATVPSDLVLQVYADGTPTLNGTFYLDSVQVFPLTAPFNYSTARASRAFNPESYDGTTGAIQIRPGDGQQLRAGFTLRNNLYLAKDHYLCYTTDDGVNEPASWSVNEVSSTIGICGPNAVDSTEEWAVFAERSGVYICYGSDPVKISQEISTDASLTGKPAWDGINWAYGHTIWVRIDRNRRLILVGVPMGTATTPNLVWALDYKWLDTAEETATTPMVNYSAFTGKLLAHGKGRRWSPWNISANSMCFAERGDGTAQPFFGNGLNNGKIYQQLPCNQQAFDDLAFPVVGVPDPPTAIAWQYQGYACPSTLEEQTYQLGASRKLAGYLKFQAIGAGQLQLAISTAARTKALRSYTLSMNPAGDGERPLNMQSERFFISAGTNAVGDWGQLEKLILALKKSPSTPVRGVSA